MDRITNGVCTVQNKIKCDPLKLSEVNISRMFFSIHFKCLV